MGKIMIIGAAIADVLACPVGPEVFKTGSMAAEDIVLSTGGDGLNEATVLAGLGEEPFLCTVLGEDFAGEIIRNHCQSKGISRDYICSDSTLSTGINVVLVEKNGERSFLTNPYGTLRNLKLGHIPNPFPKEVEILCLASIFVSPHLGNRELTALFSRAKDQGICVCADMTKRKNQETAWDMRDSLSCVDYLFANQEEGALLTGREEPEEIGAVLLECGAGCVIIKQGARGCYIRNREKSFALPGFPVNCVDTTGAGDSFAAGFLYGLSKGLELSDCGLYGNACGALAVEQLGACRGEISPDKRKEIIEGQRRKNGEKNL